VEKEEAVMNKGMLLLVTASLVGCALDGTKGNRASEEVSTTSQAISTPFPTYWETDNGGGTIGSDANQTCFMSGLTGEFGGTPGVQDSFGTEPAVFSFAGLKDQDGTWSYQDTSGGGAGVGFFFQCLQGQVTNRCKATSYSYSNGTSSPAYCSANPNGTTQCFLMNIQSAGVASPNMNVAISGGVSQGYYQIDASMEGVASDQAIIEGSAEMVCIDVVGMKGNWVIAPLIGPTNDTNSAIAETTLVNNYGNMLSVSDITCGLISVGNNWTISPNPLDWDDGIWPVNNNGHWAYMASNGHRAQIACFE
jgi:hypothetical protein